MSNYRNGYGFDAAAFPGGRALTPKQRRRMNKKANRDLRHGAAANAGAVNPGNPNPPAPLSGHPGRRRWLERKATPLRGSFVRYVAIRKPRPAVPEQHPFNVAMAEHAHRMIDPAMLAPRTARQRPPAWASRLELVSRAAHLAERAS